MISYMLWLAKSYIGLIINIISLLLNLSFTFLLIQNITIFKGFSYFPVYGYDPKS